MRSRPDSPKAPPFNRRAFLRGATGVVVALPFLDSLPERSAWAADATPVFAFFICAVDGVVVPQFFPTATGPITPATLAAANAATSQLAGHAGNLILLSGINRPAIRYDAHVDGLCAAFTGKAAQLPTGSGVTGATAGGPSADAYIAAKVHPDKVPIALYAGNITNGYEAHRLSFTGAGQLTTPISANPYDLYLELMGLALPGGTMTPASRRTAELLLQSRKSVHDLVRDDLTSLMRHPRLGSADHQRLQQHFDAIRDAEKTMAGLGGQIVDQCTSVGLDVTTLDALKGYRYDKRRTDEIATLHMSLVAMAFACNYRRAASLQWGDPNDNTVYDVPSNDRGWKFNFISHRINSDAAVGDDPLAAKAHAEIDVLRMGALSAGLDHFKARGLADQCVVTWTVNYADGPSHSPHNVPHVIWGSGGGFLKQAQFLDAGGTLNNRLLNTLLTATLQDQHLTVQDFGDGEGGLLDLIRA
jgi:hypothetical protein